MEQSEYITRLIYHHLVGDISAEAQRELDAWVAEAPHRQAMYDRLCSEDYLRREWSRHRAIDPHRAMQAMQARIEAAGQEMGRASSHRARTVFFALVGSAAMVLMVFGLYRYAQPREDHHPVRPRVAMVASRGIVHGSTRAMLTTDHGDTLYLGDDATTNAGQMAKVEGSDDIRVKRLVTPRGGEFKVTLEDGTEVWLNAESRLDYPETFGDGDRRVSVDGEAYFKVAKDNRRPFYVETAGQQVRVVGTEFNVRSYPEDAAVTTTLVHGSIALRRAAAGGAELVLTPGHQAHFDKLSQAATVSTVDTDIETSWRNGRFVFENQTLVQIMRTLSRWYDFDYEFRDKSLAKTEFMGSVPRYGEFAEVLAILEASGGIKFRQKGRTILISKK